MKPSRGAVARGALVLIAVVTSIAATDDSGWYVGANAGQSKAKIDDRRIVADLLDEGFDTTAIKDDNRHFGYKLFGGYQINKYFALESGYFNLGKFGYTANTRPSGGLTGNIKLQGANIDAVALLPFTDRFSAFGRFGYEYAYAKDDFAGYGDVIVADPERSQHAGNYKFGVGLQYALTRNWGMRAEAERYRVDDAVGNKGNIDLFTVGLLYRFGGAAPPPPPAPKTAALEPEPAPPPPSPAPPSPPVRNTVSFSADSLFDFDRSTVKLAGKQALDGFAAKLQGDQFEVITVTGYTDRIGSHAYNQSLSERRAEAVKSYLVNSAGIPEHKVVARGADGSNPVTKPDECKGEGHSPELIACLQPDRRVEVEVSGTRLQAAPAQ